MSVNQLRSSVDNNYESAAVRAFYLQFLSPRAVKAFLSTKLIRKIDAQLAEDWSTTPSDYNSDPCKELVLDAYLMTAIDYAYQRVEDVERNIENGFWAVYPDHHIKLCMNLTSNIKFKEGLELLLVELNDRNDKKDMLRLHKWWQANHDVWIQSFLELTTKCRDIGWAWDFNREDFELLMDYIDANELLVDCIGESSVRFGLKEAIIKRLFLPRIILLVFK